MTMTTTDTVLDCGHPATEPRSQFSVGYGERADGTHHCYECCAGFERDSMIETGRAVLYLDMVGRTVSDWPGHLRFPIRYLRESWHNIGGKRRDFEFTGPDGAIWSGYQIGQWNEIAHCKRTKRTR